MEQENEPNPQAHVLKGLRRLRFDTPVQSLPQVRNSVYRWWWEFLRLSKDYWMVCQISEPHQYQVSTADDQLARVYRIFGDIHSVSFDEWWIDRGYRVFEEQLKFPKVTEVERNGRERSQHRYFKDHVWIDIPLKLSRRTIQRQIGKILDQYEEQRLRNRLELSTSQFKIHPVQYRLTTLMRIHQVHALHREVIAKPKALQQSGDQSSYQLRADLFRIGKLLRVSPSNEHLRGDPQEIFKHQNRMRASVSRYLARAKLLIANAERGSFPNFSPIAQSDSKRFNSLQLERHSELEAKWWQLDLTSELSQVKIEDAKRIHYEEELKTRQASMIIR